MDITKYYTDFQNGKGYLETFQDLLEHPYLRSQQDPFGNLKSDYKVFSDQAIDQLIAIYRDYDFDVKAESFRENETLRSLVAEMILSLSLAKTSALTVVLEAMNFSQDFKKFFIKLDELCYRSKNLFSKYETDGLEGIFFSDFVWINQVQIKIALEYEFGFYNEKTNSPHSKTEFKNLLRRIDYALHNGNSMRHLDSYDRIYSGENRDFWRNLALGTYRRNDAGSQNLSAIAITTFNLLKLLNPEDAEHKIMFDLYDIFEVIYSYKGLDASADPYVPQYLAVKDEEEKIEPLTFKRVYDYKLDAVRSILGLT